jgi:hypothetical protein
MKTFVFIVLALLIGASGPIAPVSAVGITVLSMSIGFGSGMLSGFPCNSLVLSQRDAEVQKIINQLFSCIQSSTTY